MATAIALLRIFLWVALMLSCNAAIAQDAQISTGNCSPVVKNVAGSITFNIRCDTFNGNTIIYKFDDQSISVVSRYFQVDANAIINVLSQVNGERVPPDQLVERVTELVNFYRATYEASKNGDKEDADVSTALHQMNTTKALDAYERLTNSLEAVSRQKGSVDILARQARAERDYGNLLRAVHKYDLAYKHFDAALALLPGQFAPQIVDLKLSRAEAALLGFGHESNQIEPLVDEAIAAVRAAGSEGSFEIRALELQFLMLSGRGDYAESMKLFRSKLSPAMIAAAQAGTVRQQDMVLCLACAVEAANEVEKYKEAIEIGDFGLRYYDIQSATRPTSYVTLVLNRAYAIGMLGRKGEAKGEVLKALEILKHQAPDGLNPAYAYAYKQLGGLEEDSERKKQFYMEAIVAAARNQPVSSAAARAVIEGSLGGFEVMCFHAKTDRRKNLAGTVQMFEPPLFTFDPVDCTAGYQLVGDLVQWDSEDFGALESRIRTALSSYIVEPDFTWTEVSLDICNQLMLAGWQQAGRDLCAKQMKHAVEKRYLSYETAESAFRMSQLIVKAGYDFDLPAETLFRFSIEAFESLFDRKETETCDAVLVYYTYLLASARKADAKVMYAEFLEKHKASSTDQAFKKLAHEIDELDALKMAPYRLAMKRQFYMSPSFK